MQWRVRAVRKLYGSLPNGLPVVSARAVEPDVRLDEPARLDRADVAARDGLRRDRHAGEPGRAQPHAGASSTAGDTATNGMTGRLYRVYVSTDKQCVNIVFTGAVVGSPAYAPRTSGPIAAARPRPPPSRPPRPRTSATARRAEHVHGRLRAVTTDGVDPGASAASSSRHEPPHPRSPPTSAPPARTSTSGTAAGRPAATTGRSCRFARVDDGHGVQYFDAEVPQDACAAGRVAEFGKVSQPATTSWIEAVRLGPRPRPASSSPPRPPPRRSTAPHWSPGRRHSVRPATRCSGRRRRTRGSPRRRRPSTPPRPRCLLEGLDARHLVLPRPRHRPVRPRPGQADDLVDAGADQAGQADVLRPGPHRHDAARSRSREQPLLVRRRRTCSAAEAERRRARRTGRRRSARRRAPSPRRARI